jgi:hypothetical protein
MKQPTVGFGDEASRRGRTMTMNAFITTTTTPVNGGADVTIEPRRGYIFVPEVDHDTGSVTVRTRKDAGPRLGERIMVGKRLVEVAERRWTSKGTLQVRDSITGAWVEVQR